VLNTCAKGQLVIQEQIIRQVYDIHSYDMKDTARKQNFLIYREAMTIETPTTTQKNCNSHYILYDSIFLLIVMFILQTQNVQQLGSTDIKLSHHAFLDTYFTFSHFTLWGGKSVL